MQRVRLFGKGAVTFHNGKEIIRSENGHVDVPPNMIPQALAAGFTRQPTGPDVPELETPSELAKLDAASDVALVGAGDLGAAPAEDPAETARELRKLLPVARAAIYRDEVKRAGYDGDALETIVAERLRFDDLIAEGKTEEEAAAIVWGGHTAAPSEPVTEPVTEPAPAPAPAVVEEPAAFEVHDGPDTKQEND